MSLNKLPYRMPEKYGGYRTQDAKDICEEFLWWFINLLKEYKPQAWRTIRQLEDALEEIEIWEMEGAIDE